MYRDDEGLGYNVLEIAERQERIGICGLVKRDEFRHPDLGYALLDERSGKGYATEAAFAVLQHAIAGLELPIVLAIATPGNHASRRVLEKIGMRLDAESDRCIYVWGRCAQGYLARSSIGANLDIGG